MTLPLPKPEDDPIIRLYDYYFSASDLMFESFDPLWAALATKGSLTPRRTFKMQRFGQIWLATLWVVGEGFQDSTIKEFFGAAAANDLTLKVHWDSVQHMLLQLGPELKRYRNATFHFQEKMTTLEAKRLGFLAHEGRREPIQWARQLHKEMRMFFGRYRVEAMVREATRLPSLVARDC